MGGKKENTGKINNLWARPEVLLRNKPFPFRSKASGYKTHNVGINHCLF